MARSTIVRRGVRATTQAPHENAGLRWTLNGRWPIGSTEGSQSVFKDYRKVLWFTLIVNAAMVLVDRGGARLHEAGLGQPVLGYIMGANQVAGMPGMVVAERNGLRPRQKWTWSGFWVGLGVNLMVYGAVGTAWMRMTSPRGMIESAEEERRGEEVSRRSLLFGGGKAFAAAGMGTGAWGFFGESRWFEVTQRKIGIRGLPGKLNGLRIVHLSDIHHGPWMSIDWVLQVVDTTASLMPDLVLLTGDYTYRGLQYIEPVARELGRLRPAIGIAAVRGNHDWWEGGGPVTKAAFERHGIPIIDNDRRFITPDRRLVRHATDGLCIAGIGDLWEDQCEFDKALGGISGGMPRLLLSHHPDAAEHVAFLTSGLRVDLMMCGHTHGGQVRLPVVGSPVTNSRFGQKYVEGLVEGPVCRVLISRGLGMTALPVRLGVRAEVGVIELVRATNG